MSLAPIVVRREDDCAQLRIQERFEITRRDIRLSKSNMRRFHWETLFNPNRNTTEYLELVCRWSNSELAGQFDELLFAPFSLYRSGEKLEGVVAG